MRQAGLYLFLIVLAISCSSEANNEALAPTAAYWTDWFTKNGFRDLSLSSEIDLPDGRSEHSLELSYSEEKKIAAHQEIMVTEGMLRELRITFQPALGADLDSVFLEINTRIEYLYGNAKPTIAYSSWRAPSQNGTLMEIEVMDARPLFQRDEIIVHWKEYEDRRYED